MTTTFLIETDNFGTIEIEGEHFGKCLKENTIIHSELVFTTGMSGLLETITDPSFSDQILVLSFPPFGNYGAPYNRVDKTSKESIKDMVKGGLYSDLFLSGDAFSIYRTEYLWDETNEKERLGFNFFRLDNKFRVH